MAAWLGSAAIAAAATGWVLSRLIIDLGRPTTGMDFWNNTWRAVRGLLSGADIYRPAHVTVQEIGHGWPVSLHVPGSLLWQAPFALLPLRAAVLAYALVSIAAIWAGLFMATLPRGPAAVLAAACCGALALTGGAGLATLLLGQPTGFTLLGLAILTRARRPWLGALGFLLAASTIQTGLPLALALLVLGGWPVVWRGVTLVLITSLPPLGLEITNAGIHASISSLISAATFRASPFATRVDLDALLQRLGITNVAVQACAGLLVVAMALIFLTRLPPHLRRIDYPPVLCLVIAFTLVCIYHESYDMLLVSGAVVPVILVSDRSRAMLPAFALGGIGAALAGYTIGFVVVPLALLGTGLLSGRAARQAAVAAVEPAPHQAAGSPVASGSSGDLEAARRILLPPGPGAHDCPKTGRR